MSYLKPQNPIKLGEDHIYPLTTSDQVILNNGNRLNSLFKKTIKENITLLSSNWSETLPYMQAVTLNESTDDYNVDANVVYGGDNDVALNKAASYISYIKKNHKEITFYCLKKKPEIDIPVEVTCTCRNTIATVEEGIKLNFDVVAYGSEEELLADTPAENTIGIITDTPITGYHFSATEPENMNEGEVWIWTGDSSNVAFNSLKIDDAYTNMVYPLSARQLTGGVLVDVEAMSYQGMTWNEWWNGELYTPGNEYENITGGWVLTEKKGTAYTHIGTLTKDETGLIVSNDSTVSASGSGSFIRCRNRIDVSNFNTISAVVENISGSIGGGTITVASDLALNAYDLTNVVAQSIQITGSGTFTVDISDVTGVYYVGITLDAANAKKNVSRISEVKMS